jgi:hypothetical protein
MKSAVQTIADVVVMILVSIVIIGILGTPTWIILAAKWLLEAKGFWQNLLVYGIGFYLLGGLQVVCLIAGLMVLAAIWLGPPNSPQSRK